VSKDNTTTKADVAK